MEARSHGRVEYSRWIFWIGCCVFLALGAHGELPDHPTTYTPPTLESLDCPSEVEPVHTPSNGPICGGKPKGYSGLRAFWGIPYAADTSEFRWMPPQSLDGSATDAASQPMEARAFGPWCPQIHQGELVGSEDCLRVNVWTPNVSGKLPVMVYIHGGAFIMGASDVPEPSTPKPKGASEAQPYGSNLYDGAYLSHTHDVVVVSMNYRVGAMGFLSNGKKKGDLGGNYGFMDQQAALHWVQKNISAFGGDPQQVTIFGESAGAMSVGLHMLSAPSSYDGKLFRAGIRQSNLPGLPYKTPQQGKGDFDTFAAQVLKAEKSKVKTCDVKCLRAASLKNLLTAQSKTLPAFLQGAAGAVSALDAGAGRHVDHPATGGRYLQAAGHLWHQRQRGHSLCGADHRRGFQERWKQEEVRGVPHTPRIRADTLRVLSRFCRRHHRQLSLRSALRQASSVSHRPELFPRLDRLHLHLRQP